jgi:hypothetical protein
MLQRGRKSLDHVVSLGVDGVRPRVTAPPDLTRPERALFNELVASVDPRHFVTSDVPLLVSFIQSTLLSRRAAVKMEKNIDWIKPWEAATRMQSLATRLRLAPQARTSPMTASRHAAYQPQPEVKSEKW